MHRDYNRVEKRPYIPIGCTQQDRVTPTLDEPVPSEFYASDWQGFDGTPEPETDDGGALRAVLGWGLVMLALAAGLAWLVQP